MSSGRESSGGRRFWPALGVIALVALAIRVIYVLGWHHPVVVGGDAFYYHFGANLFADGRGFPHPYRLLQDHVNTPGAQHPPLFLVVLGLGSLVGLRSFLCHQLLSCVLGAGTVVVLGVTGRRLAGPGAGLIAATIAAVYPNFWFNDALVMSETLVQLTVAGAVLAGYRFAASPSVRRAAVLGLVVALATLTRAEGALLAVAIVVPLCLVAVRRRTPNGRRLPWRRCVGLLAVAGAVGIAVLAPWVAYNESRFARPVTLSTGLDPTLVVTNCADAYQGTFRGYWSFQCLARLPIPPGDDSERGEVYRRIGLDYARAHSAEVPGVLLAREGRMWGLYRPRQEITFDTIETRELPASHVGLAMYYALAVASVAGALLLRRRRIPLSPLVAPLLMSAAAAALAGGLTRYRAAAEVSLVLLAAVAIAGLGRRQPTPPADEPGQQRAADLALGPP